MTNIKTLYYNTPLSRGVGKIYGAITNNRKSTVVNPSLNGNEMFDIPHKVECIINHNTNDSS